MTLSYVGNTKSDRSQTRSRQIQEATWKRILRGRAPGSRDLSDERQKAFYQSRSKAPNQDGRERESNKDLAWRLFKAQVWWKAGEKNVKTS